MARKPLVLILALCVAFSLVSLSAALSGDGPKVGDKLTKLQFPKLVFPEDQQYLGLANTGPFTVKDVKAPFVLVDIFATTCPHCVQQAPTLNGLFNLASQNPKVGDKLKFIAVGAHDNEFKVKFWKQNFQVKFALLADPEGKLFNSLDLPGTPVTLVLDKDGKVLYKHLGSIEDAETALKEIMAALKL
jgi:thiol-disulfide isomerase/thioredoxin